MEQEFEKADQNHDGFISVDEFTLYYFSELCFKFPVYKNGYNPGNTSHREEQNTLPEDFEFLGIIVSKQSLKKPDIAPHLGPMVSKHNGDRGMHFISDGIDDKHQ